MTRWKEFNVFLRGQPLSPYRRTVVSPDLSRYLAYFDGQGFRPRCSTHRGPHQCESRFTSRVTKPGSFTTTESRSSSLKHYRTNAVVIGWGHRCDCETPGKVASLG